MLSTSFLQFILLIIAAIAYCENGTNSSENNLARENNEEELLAETILELFRRNFASGTLNRSKGNENSGLLLIRGVKFYTEQSTSTFDNTVRFMHS